ncbi:class A beta-lactamase [Curtobacterium luteum]|uniref:Beta-lactamase n=1 Tax=Curtobacterium luteum TaxID=33881 RepID=A0A175RVX1_9MICO|nr:class A beta-lactamase [Curtobacterium luteum]KTR07009.1 beta-lactamase [Curtobacterium luteum]
MRGTRWTALVVGIALGAVLVGCSGPDAPSGGTSRPVDSAPAPRPSALTAAPTVSANADSAFAALERGSDARLGVVAVDTESGTTLAYRGGDRFPFASTNKVFIAAAVLDRSSAADLDTVVHYDRGDLLAYAPVTARHVDTGMTVLELVDAAVSMSDNTAANLLVERLGGPDAVEAWLRGIGDRTTRVDRLEPELNAATPGDVRDTSTPEQFAADLRDVLLGDVLDADDRRVLQRAMLATTTGDGTIRAGVPSGWRVADKTGTGEYGVRNDIGLVTPPGRRPIVLVVMTRTDRPDAGPSDALVAEATRTAVGALRR